MNPSLLFSVLSQFIMMLYNIVSEKDLKLRQVRSWEDDEQGRFVSRFFPPFCALYYAGLEADWTEGLSVLVLMVCRSHSCDNVLP